MTAAPTVSAILLSYNRPGDAPPRVGSLVVAQSYPNLRVLVVDNKSPASDRICELVAGFSGVEFIANPTNTGFTVSDEPRPSACEWEVCPVH